MQPISYPKYMFLRVLASWIWEPSAQFRASREYRLGWKQPFNFYGLNPVQISEDQARQPPILLLHGNWHNQSAWLSFAESAAKSGFGSLYTVNLPSGSLSEQDIAIVNDKIAEIKAQYKLHKRDDIKVHLVGHSRGARIAYYMAAEESGWHFNKVEAVLTGEKIVLRRDIGKIIKLGYPTSEWDIGHFGAITQAYDVVGMEDVIVTHRSKLPAKHYLEVECGHVGLLYHPAVHEQIIKWLSN
jgi:hypothetical protein